MNQSKRIADLSGKTAIVTGSTQGVGASVAKVLAQCGANVVILGPNVDDGNALQTELRAAGAKVIYSETDIRYDKDIDACIDRTIQAFSRIDILVNNACSYEDHGLESTRDEWHRTLGVNLISAAIFAQKVVPHFQRGSVIVNMGSTGGKFGAAGRALYPASKAGMLQLTKNMAVSLADRGIRAVAVSPAWTWSPSVERLSAGSRADADRVGAQVHPLGRIGSGVEIGNVIAFLVSDGASWVTGVDVPVDGGFSILGPDQGKSPKVWFQQILGDRGAH